MPVGDVGAVAKLLDGIASWLMSEDGYGQFKKRRELERAKTAAMRALKDHDWERLRATTSELERLSRKS